MMQYIMNIISDMLCSNMLWSSRLGREVHNIAAVDKLDVETLLIVMPLPQKIYI